MVILFLLDIVLLTHFSVLLIFVINFISILLFLFYRAQKRMNKERVFNSQIVVSLPFAVKEESSSTSFISINNIQINLKLVLYETFAII